MIPTERQYWQSLARAINLFLRSSGVPSLRFLSIDDIMVETPVSYDAMNKTVSLIAWMLGDASQEKFRLMIELVRTLEEMGQVDWDRLLNRPISSTVLKVDKPGRAMTLLAA